MKVQETVNQEIREGFKETERLSKIISIIGNWRGSQRAWKAFGEKQEPKEVETGELIQGE